MKISSSFVVGFKENEFLYGNYVRHFSRISTDWPDSSTDCHQTGFPRCANTFSRFLVSSFFPEKSIVTHIHAVSSIKAALRHGVMTQVIVRDPASCVASLCMKRSLAPENTEAVRAIVAEYLRYHRYVLEVSHRLSVLPFEVVTKRPSDFIAFMARSFRSTLSHEEIGPRLPDLQQRFQEREKRKKVSGSSLPNTERDQRKRAYSEIIETSPRFHASVSVYEDLVSLRAV